MRTSTLLLLAALLSWGCFAVAFISAQPVYAQQDTIEFNLDDLDLADEPAGPPAALVAVLVVVGLVVALISIAILVFVLLLLSGFLKALPAEHREMEPAMVWLLLIPCFNIIWNFFVFPRISTSYQNHFKSIGRTDVGDCGAAMGLWYSICQVIGCVALPVALILLILFLVQVHGLKKQIQGKPGTATV